MKKVFVLALAALVMGSAAIAQTGEKECCKKKEGGKKCCKKEAKGDAKAAKATTATPAPVPAHNK
jgi:hypothetical protein